MLNGLNNIVNFLNGYIWGVGMLVLIVGSGLYFTIRLHGFQFVHFILFLCIYASFIFVNQKTVSFIIVLR